jgi:hypothetical protein
LLPDAVIDCYPRLVTDDNGLLKAVAYIRDELLPLAGKDDVVPDNRVRAGIEINIAVVVIVGDAVFNGGIGRAVTAVDAFAVVIGNLAASENRSI